MTSVRRFRGPSADEIHVLCRPDDVAEGVEQQSESVYRKLFEALASEGAGLDSLVAETLWCCRRGASHAETLAARSRVLDPLADETYSAATTVIEQPPLRPGASIELGATAIVPHRGVDVSSHDVVVRRSDDRDACQSGIRAKTLRIGGRRCFHSANIYGRGASPLEEARDMFRAAEDILAAAGLGFGAVVRTWIYLRDIDRDYDVLNRARREFFDRCGVELRPASTGVQGGALPGLHDFSMTVCAVESTEAPLEVSPMTTPTLNEAPTYGADFSRGMRVADGESVKLYVSGTASIDEAGRSVHAGDFDAQVGRMLLNIESLLAGQGATYGDLVSGVVYLKHPDSAPRLRTMLSERGFEGFPCALVEAPLCRPELLCEAEVLGILPIGTSAA